MPRDHLFPTADAWNWRRDLPFSRAVAVGDQVFVSAQPSLDAKGQVQDPGDIAAQTRNVFENLKQSLAEAGLGLEDLVRLNTYYLFDGPDEEATAYWEAMTRVRLEYFPDPGPAATAVRVKGLPYAGLMIQIEAVALRGRSRQERQRIMPAGSWDWSIAVPLSQGWKIGERIFVGGQISADETGGSVHVGDLDAQARAIFRFIERVLADAGAGPDDLVRVKVCFKHDSRLPSGQSYADRIMQVAAEELGDPGPVLSAFSVDLLYPGLDLEIDAMAIVDPHRKTLAPRGLGGRYQPAPFSDGISAAGETYVGGQVALAEDGAVLAPDDAAGQARIVFARLAKVLAEAGLGLEEVVKLNLFLVGEDAEIEALFHRVAAIWAEVAPAAHPAMSAVRVEELPRPGLLVQADCVALA